MANPFPFVAGDVLTAAELNGIGESAVSFTPTITNYTRGNGVSSAYYLQINKLVYVYMRETLGSTSSVTGQPSLSLPIAATRLDAIQNGISRIDDAGTNTFWGITSAVNSTDVSLFAQLAGGTYVSIINTSSTVPMTWAVNDTFTMCFVYEVA
jgi:hypothetical protein